MSETTPETIPDVITRYLRAADEKDAQALAACFTADGTVVDEGVIYTGHDDIVGWREGALSKWTYTTAVLRTESVSDHEHLVFVHIEGDFPGGTADLTYRFTLRAGLISALRIVD
jgi:ketosteroid isomerase-like protein